MKTCGTCEWFAPRQHSYYPGGGMCHRYPPAVVPKPVGDCQEQHRPEVLESERCGEWTAQEKK